MPVRQSDVARLAGVSPRTVSNVVSGYTHVSAEVREKVQAAIDELGYRRSDAARGLRLGRTGVIALAVPSLRERYFADLAEAVVQRAEEHDLTVMVEVTGGDRERERLVLGGGRSSLTDGALMSAVGLTRTDAKYAAGASYPLVLIGDRQLPGPFDQVSIPNEEGAAAAVHHLVKQGCRRIALLGTPEANRSGELRLRGYLTALDEAGIAVGPPRILRADWTRREGQRVVAEMLRGDLEAGIEWPDALFAMNDSLALGALAALAELGVRVPTEMAVVGFDDVEEARFSNPPLTSVSPSVEEIARLSVELLVSRLEDPARRGRRLASRYELRQRASSIG
ncbi:LacI family DNA-binding transcriptional regulator [Kribbella sp. NPDC056861]|uniref:LacI family DNA-binding transcriptional regulator n=1 Tax=Kribbella sp. NPDC056861 TaxID=3154857 RepID=UPI00341C149E